jgi:hypothetical protein
MKVIQHDFWIFSFGSFGFFSFSQLLVGPCVVAPRPMSMCCPKPNQNWKKKHANGYFTCLVLDNMYCLDGVWGHFCPQQQIPSIVI